MNQPPHPQTPLGEAILNTIKNRGVTMRPKWYFILQLSLLIVGTILASLTLLFVVSFIVFSLRQNGSWFAPAFGWAGLHAFLVSLPWLLITLAVIFAAIVGLLVRTYSFAYGRPLLYSAVGIILFAGVGGFFVALTPFHARLLDRAERQQVPLAGPVYRTFGHRHPDNIVTGIIIQKLPDGFGLDTPADTIITVRITPDTQLPPRELRLHDVVMVFGEREGNTVQAFGIQPFQLRGIKPLPMHHPEFVR